MRRALSLLFPRQRTHWHLEADDDRPDHRAKGGAISVSEALGAAVVETHSGVVFFFGDRAYKVKKAVDLGFLDFSTREAREAACHREVELNRRLAPDVYLGVADVLDPSGALCDHLVVMRRMPADRRLSTLVTAGEPLVDHLRHLAHLVATMHDRSPRSDAADAAASADAQHARWCANTATLIDDAGRIFDEGTIALVHGLASRYIGGREVLFADRIARGRACDGHGDLLTDDIFCLEDGPRALDCLEFDDQLRLGDGLADVAFLAMDLERLGRVDLAASFLAAYQEYAGDHWPQSLADHYIAYRAQVRAKVEGIRADQGDPAAGGRARALLDLAASRLEAARVRLVLVGGRPGTGKSTLALGAGAATGAVVLRSDEVRKELAGIPTSSPAPAGYREGIYTPAAAVDTYHRMLTLADIALRHGETVILDASWSDARWRDRARLMAGADRADVVELRCTAPAPLASERLLARAAAGGDSSDASPAVAAAMAAAEDPWPTATAIDTARDPASSSADVVEHITRRVAPVAA